MADAVQDETLLIAQRNEIFRLAQNRGLDAELFAWAENQHSNGAVTWRNSILRCGESYYCEFRSWLNDWDLRCSPCGDRRYGILKAASWPDAAKQVAHWLDWIKRETEPDLWKELAKDSNAGLLGASSGEDDNRPLEKAEQARIASAASQIAEHLEPEIADETRRQMVDANIAHLVEASKRLGRKDWIALAAGILAQIATGLAMQPGAARELFRLASSLFEWLWGGPRLLP